MDTTIVYVLVSRQEDTYLEQLYFSMYSLKLQNRDAKISIVCDSATSNSFIGNREQLVKIADDIIIVDVPDKYNNMQKSRYIKTSLRKHIKGDYIYIDNDTIISDDLSDVDNLKYSLMGVPDFHSTLEKYPGNKDFYDFSIKTNLNFDNHKYCFNGGVIYSKDDQISHNFYDTWHNEWLRYLDLGYSTDQQSLFAANEKCGFPIMLLDNAYNCQIMFNGLKYLYKAKIIHYFASGFENSKLIEQPYIFQNNKHYEYLKDHGNLDEDCVEALKNPKGAFVDNVQIVTSFQNEFNNTPLYSSIRNFYNNNPKLINFLSKMKSILIKR